MASKTRFTAQSDVGEDMERRYLKLHQTPVIIGLAHDCSRTTVLKILRERGVKLRASARGGFTFGRRS